MNGYGKIAWREILDAEIKSFNEIYRPGDTLSTILGTLASVREAFLRAERAASKVHAPSCPKSQEGFAYIAGDACDCGTIP